MEDFCFNKWVIIFSMTDNDVDHYERMMSARLLSCLLFFFFWFLLFDDTK